MFTGEERFVLDGENTSYDMLGFWQWTLSCIYDGTTRGSFAEYIVKLALDHGGFKYNDEPKTGMELYDLEGPKIPSMGRPSRVEVKSTGYFLINPYTGYRRTKGQQFSIKKKKVPDETGDFNENSIAKRNNDIYVLSVYNGKSEEENIFDLALWDFYVLPTFWLNRDPAWRERTSITLSKVQEMCEKKSFEELPGAIADACKLIPADEEE